jgi:hypothetical protein
VPHQYFVPPICQAPTIHCQTVVLVSLSVCISVYGSTALCWMLAAFQILNPVHSRYYSLEGRSARRQAATYTQNNTDTEQMHTKTSMSRVGFEPTIPVLKRRQFMP